MQKSTSRSSEVGDPMRRSFSGNPFQKPSIVANPRGFNPITPANSPSDWSVRGRESNTMRFLRESEEKENGRDSNPNRKAAKSPSMAKGVKNFMSPTISAASKVNASPSKKILTERNHHEQQPPPRNSVSSLDLRSSCSSVSNLSETLEESQIEAELDRKDSKKVAFDSVIEPIDADPLTPMTPYDPKTNYLAPRPKFLYYKPRRRIGSCLDAEMESNPLDGDGFFSDSFSEETTESDSSQIVSEDVSSETEEEEEEEEAAVTEPNIQSPEMAMEAPRKHFLTKSKCILSVFILLIACSAMGDLRIRSYSMIKESGFPVVMEVVSREAEHVEQNLRIWRDESVSFIGRLVSELRGEEDRQFRITFVNLTYLDEPQWNNKKKLYGNLITDGYAVGEVFEQNVQIEAKVLEEVEEDVEEDSAESGLGGESDESSSISVEQEEIIEESELDPVRSSKVVVQEEEEEEEEEGGEILSTEEVISVEEKIIEESELDPVQSGKVEEEKVILLMEEENIIQEESEPELPQIEEVISSTDRIEAIPSQAAAETEDPESIESSFLKRMIQIASSVLGLATVAAFVCLKKKASSMAVPNTVEQKQKQEQVVVAAKRFNISPVSGNLMTEFDVVGDSWHSEISSFPRKSSRRESLASSSSSDMSPSPSYGSFTTYEMIPKKKRNGDGEPVKITPIRRSSRLRK